MEIGDTPTEPIDIEPIESETTIDFDNLTDLDLTNVVVNNVHYNLPGDNGYDPVEGCIIINDSPTSEVVLDSGGEKTFIGLTIKVNGKGVIDFDCQTLGTKLLYVQVGNDIPNTFTMIERGTLHVAYDVNKPTFVYIYAGYTTRAPHSVAASENCVQIWSLEVKPGAEPTSIIPIEHSSPLTIDQYYTLDGRKMKGTSSKKGVYIVI